jgi:hypothetical protein
MLLLKHIDATQYSMGRQQTYHARMAELGWTEYRLVQEIVKIRNARGQETTLQGIQSTINKALKEPEGRATYINDDIVKALGGRTIIEWEATPTRVEL